MTASDDTRCGGSGTFSRVLTPTLDHRDPAFDYEEFDCPGCPDCEGPRIDLRAGDCIDVMRELAPESVAAVCTDPPYSLSFMAREWDSHESPAAFQAWCETWAREALRVLKPGGHLLAFGGTRTYHRLAAGVEDAGFEIRDTIAWMYGSGFPKSLDVGKAIDGMDRPCAQQATALEFTAWLRMTGVTAAAMNEATGTRMGGHYLTPAQQPQIPTAAMWALVRPLIAIPVPGWVDEMIGYRAKSENLARRDVVGETTGTRLVYSPGEDEKPEVATWNLTTPATPEAREWHGWGTALKPAYEPIVVARKPLTGTVARNVLRYGTGGLNVDACRLDMSDEDREKFEVGSAAWARRDERAGEGRKIADVYGTYGATAPSSAHDAGRWPPNVMLDGEAAAQLDEQSGESSSSSSSPLPLTPGDARGSDHGSRGVETMRGHNDSGGASRFMYCAKAGSAERAAGLDDFEAAPAMELPDAEWAVTANAYLAGGPTVRRNTHPTVKPVDVMRWLVRLVTPPAGVVLDPFLGSGTTGIAATLEGFAFVGIERHAEYLEIARARIAWWQRFDTGTDTDDALTAGRRRDEREQTGQLTLLGDEEAA